MFLLAYYTNITWLLQTAHHENVWAFFDNLLDLIDIGWSVVSSLIPLKCKVRNSFTVGRLHMLFPALRFARK
jgi:hypothetical protein